MPGEIAINNVERELLLQKAFIADRSQIRHSPALFVLRSLVPFTTLQKENYHFRKEIQLFTGVGNVFFSCHIGEESTYHSLCCVIAVIFSCCSALV